MNEKEILQEDRMASVAGGEYPTDVFSGLPIEELISGPLQAAAEAQKLLAKSTQDYTDQVGLSETSGRHKVFIKTTPWK